MEESFNAMSISLGLGLLLLIRVLKIRFLAVFSIEKHLIFDIMYRFFSFRHDSPKKFHPGKVSLMSNLNIDETWI